MGLVSYGKDSPYVPELLRRVIGTQVESKKSPCR